MGPTDPYCHRNLKLGKLTSEMTLLLDVPIGDADPDGKPIAATAGVLDLHPAQIERHPVVLVDPSPFAVLLEDGELSAWAKQAGTKYLISELDALWLLAQALLLDGPVAETGGELRG
jgi:hypothetical protein